MSPERWKRLKSLYGRASDLEGGDRGRFLDDASASDPSVAGELRDLLQHSGDASRLTPPLDRLPDSDEPERTFPPGFDLGGRYRIESLLGAGGMGEVYRAHDRDTGDAVAIKVLRSALAGQPDLQRRLRREVSLARRISHINICRVFDLQRAPGPSGGVLFLTMELLPGETLHERLARGPLPFSEACAIASQLIDGLSSAHANGVVHRDLKDGNVMLVPAPDGQCRVVITDFGLAREQDPVEATGSAFATGAIVGTAAYMAPEQLQGGSASVASDIYALGVILFRMATGRLPFDGETPLAIALRRLQSAAPSPRDFAGGLDRRWERAILACLDSDPARRPATAEAVRSILAGITSPRIRRPRRWFLIGGAAALCAGAAAVLVLPHAPLPGPEAVRRFKLAEEFVRRRTAGDLQNAAKEYQAAIALEPKYADAWAGLADALAARANFDLGDSRESLRQARAAAERAVALNGRSARAVGILGYCISIDVDSWRAAEPYLRRAVELDPRQPTSRLWYGSFLGKSGRTEAAIAELQAGLAEEPTSMALNQQLASEYLRVGENAKALETARELVRLQPFQANGYLVLARAYDALGDFAAGLRACDDAAKYLNHPDVDAVRATVLVSAGRRPDALLIAERLDALWREEKFASQMLAKLWARLGDGPRSLAVLRAGVDRKEASVIGSLLNPVFRPLFDDPGFHDLLRRVQLDPALLKAYR